MQTVSFTSMVEFLAFLPQEELGITEYLREMVLKSIPGVKEKLSYNVPFYLNNRAICFIWPASILWGSKKTYEGVRFGFAKGFLMNDAMGYLDKGNRKQVYYKDFLTLEEIDPDILNSYILEAARVDTHFIGKK